MVRSGEKLGSAGEPKAGVDRYGLARRSKRSAGPLKLLVMVREWHHGRCGPLHGHEICQRDIDEKLIPSIYPRLLLSRALHHTTELHSIDTIQ